MSGQISNWWLLWRVPVLALTVMLVWWFVFRPMIHEQGWVRVTDGFALCSGGGAREAGCVIDGDTVVLGYGNAQRRIRLTGYDAPELDGRCEAERELANTARLRLHSWLGDGAFEWDGADDPPRDQYDRELRAVRRVGRDGSREYLADTMIESDLASGNGWSAGQHDWCD